MYCCLVACLAVRFDQLYKQQGVHFHNYYFNIALGYTGRYHANYIAAKLQVHNTSNNAKGNK